MQSINTFHHCTIHLYHKYSRLCVCTYDIALALHCIQFFVAVKVKKDKIDPEKLDDNSELNVFSCGDGGRAGLEATILSTVPCTLNIQTWFASQGGERAMRPTTFRVIELN